ncbi:hypothetical protein B0T20DRAFT_392427 [Sordaria brevicollis]|uniref:Uncharacterized protein n=1 Tax=Sordaria brevicollis TaxID=83679 RepID=A0AAE0UCU5_SORBR|nr:hypothetical protein B0T20DRAFT_392427 [Sordaria brevicollis]
MDDLAGRSANANIKHQDHSDQSHVAPNAANDPTFPHWDYVNHNVSIAHAAMESINNMDLPESRRYVMKVHILDMLKEKLSAAKAAYCANSTASREPSKKVSAGTTARDSRSPRPKLSSPKPLPGGPWAQDESSSLDPDVAYPDPAPIISSELEDQMAPAPAPAALQQEAPNLAATNASEHIPPSHNHLTDNHLTHNHLTNDHLTQVTHDAPSIFHEEPDEAGLVDQAMDAQVEHSASASDMPVPPGPISPQTSNLQTMSTQVPKQTSATQPAPQATHPPTTSTQTVSTTSTSTPTCCADHASGRRRPITIEKECSFAGCQAKGYYTCTGCIRTRMCVVGKYCEERCLAKMRAQNLRRKNNIPASRPGGGGSKKGDVGGRKKRAGQAAGGVLGGGVQKST